MFLLCGCCQTGSAEVLSLLREALWIRPHAPDAQPRQTTELSPALASGGHVQPSLAPSEVGDRTGRSQSGCLWAPRLDTLWKVYIVPSHLSIPLVHLSHLFPYCTFDPVRPVLPLVRSFFPSSSSSSSSFLSFYPSTSLLVLVASAMPL